MQRTFAPPSPTWKYASTPFDPINSMHATHVAGIAAGSNGIQVGPDTLSGVAPNAYIGNYKVLTIPTPGFGLDGNSAEIAAAIEAAVADGMNVINLSLGEPEVEPSRDLVVTALEGAAAAGVVPVIAAGNDFDDFRYGSVVVHPPMHPTAIAVAAVTSRNTIADFSSAGPDPALAADEARRRSAGCRRHLVAAGEPGRPVRHAQRHEHGGAGGGRRRGAAQGAAP